MSRVLSLVHWIADPLLRFDFLDRSLALGAQAFSAVIPLLLVLQVGSTGLVEDLIERFDLEGEAAESVREAFTVTGDETTTTTLSVVVLIVSVLSFTRRLQRLYEGTWELGARGMRGTGWGLVWIAVLVLYWSLHPALDGIAGGLAGLVLSIAGAFVLGLLTPYLLLGRRLPWRRLVPQAMLTAVGLTALGIWSAIYMPRAFEASAATYGSIGIAFVLLTWLWGLGMVLVAAAVYGSPQLPWPPPLITRKG
jgi:membrane protein